MSYSPTCHERAMRARSCLQAMNLAQAILRRRAEESNTYAVERELLAASDEIVRAVVAAYIDAKAAE